jgi:CheY-like chemotaxis protein
MKQDYILMVEDNDDDVILFRSILEQAGIVTDIVVLETAEAAIRYLTGEGPYRDFSLRPLPRMVVVDLKLPGKSGHEVLRWLTQRPELNHLVRVVLTGSDDPKDRRVAYELGANCYLQKPLTIQQLTGPSRSIRMLFSGRFDGLEPDTGEEDRENPVKLPGRYR